MFSFVAYNSELTLELDILNQQFPLQKCSQGAVYFWMHSLPSSSHVGLWLWFGPEQEEQNCGPMKPV